MNGGGGSSCGTGLSTSISLPVEIPPVAGFSLLPLRGVLEEEDGEEEARVWLWFWIREGLARPIEDDSAASMCEGEPEPAPVPLPLPPPPKRRPRGMPPLPDRVAPINSSFPSDGISGVSSSDDPPNIAPSGKK